MKIAIVNLTTLTVVSPSTAVPFVGLVPKGRPHKESEINIVELAEALSHLGNDVTVYVSDAFLPEIPMKPKANLHVEYLPTLFKWIFSPGMLPFTPALFDRIREGGYDIVMSSNLFDWGAIVSTLASIGGKSRVVIWQEVDSYSSSATARLAQYLFYHTFGRLLGGLVDGFVSRTTVAEAFLINMGISHSKLLGVIPTGVNTDVYRPLGNNETSIRKRLNISDGSQVVTCVSTLYQDRGLDLLITAMREVVDEIPEAMLIIRGRGPLKAKLNALINDLGLEQNISILGDYFSREEMCALLNISEVALVIFRFYGFFPFAALESFACGKPVISASERTVRGLKDIIKDGTTGYLVGYDAKDISRKLTFLLKNPTLCREMGRNALELCRATLDMRIVAKRFDDLFRSRL